MSIWPWHRAILSTGGKKVKPTEIRTVDEAKEAFGDVNKKSSKRSKATTDETKTT